jgi:hypothetical protein
MSTQITTAFVNTFRTNIYMLSQQMGSKLENHCRREVQASEMDFYDRVGSVDAQEITGRHGDTPILNTPHSRRRLTLTDTEYGDMIDKMDRVRLLINPDDAYVQAAVMSLGRQKDDQIISAALGNAYSGKTGSTSVALPSSQKIAAHDGSTTTGVNLNVRTLRAVAALFDANDVDESISKKFAFTSSQKSALLGETEVSSGDYNTIRALVRGEVNSFMGFEFIRTERLPRSASNVTYNKDTGAVGSGTGTITAAQSRRCIAWAEDGLIFATAKDINARIAERADKRFGTQIYVSQSCGATRIEEVKVVEVICAEV